jgi:SAM-dependent methyltransferase
MIRINRSTHNWLAYKINNSVVSANLHLIKGKVLDLGCGNSPYRSDIIKNAEEYIGIDWPKSIHDISGVDIIGDISFSVPIRRNCLDTIVSFQVMEHLPEPGNFLAECFRCLRTEGRLLLTVPFNWHVHEEPFDYYRYTKYGLEYLLQKSGWKEFSVTENTGYWQMAVLKFNYHTFRFARGLLKIIFVPIWYLGQVCAQWLDKIDRHPQETASYTVIATKS